MMASSHKGTAVKIFVKLFIISEKITVKEMSIVQEGHQRSFDTFQDYNLFSKSLHSIFV